MVITYLLLALGILFLVKGASFLVDGSSSLAKKLGVPSLVIGLTIVAFGTSMPELLVNIFAALDGSGGVALGNIIGSNISNILLVLGLTALFFPVKIQKRTVRKGIPFVILAAIVLLVVANDLVIGGLSTQSLTRSDGIIMLLFFAIFIYYAYESARNKKEELEDKKIEVKKREHKNSIFLILIGIIGLYFGGQLTVDSAITIAQQLGLSEFLISATIIAIGTSLPELVTSITAAKKKDMDLAVGNIVGSNIFNVFWILGVTTLIAPITIPSFINPDLIFMILVSMLLFFFMFIGRKNEIDRGKGIVFISLYVLYIIFLIIRG